MIVTINENTEQEISANFTDNVSEETAKEFLQLFDRFATPGLMGGRMLSVGKEFENSAWTTTLSLYNKRISVYHTEYVGYTFDSNEVKGIYPTIIASVSFHTGAGNIKSHSVGTSL